MLFLDNFRPQEICRINHISLWSWILNSSMICIVIYCVFSCSNTIGNSISKKTPSISIKISEHFFKGSLSSNNWQPLHYVNTRITSHHFIFRHCFHPATSCLYLRSFNNFFNQSMNFYRCAYFLTTRKSNVSLLLKVTPGRVADKKLIRHYKHFSKHLPVIYLFYGLYSHYRKHLYK